MHDSKEEGPCVSEADRSITVTARPLPAPEQLHSLLLGALANEGDRNKRATFTDRVMALQEGM